LKKTQHWLSETTALPVIHFNFQLSLSLGASLSETLS